MLTDFYKTTIMKLRLFLVVLLLLPLLVKGQTDVKFYSKGKMYVQYKGTAAQKGETESTTLYIDGSAKFVTGASITQKGRTELTGDFVNGKNPSVDEGAANQLFIGKSNTEDDGVIAFIGKGAEDPVTNLPKGTLQRIYGDVDEAGATWSRALQKSVNWIDFPTIKVEKGLPGGETDDWRKVGFVMVDSSAAVAVDYLNVPATDRFSVKASYDINNVYRMNSGHALIRSLSANTSQPTYSQVNFDFYKYEDDGAGNVTADDGAFDNDYASEAARPTASSSTFGGTLRQTDGWNRLMGFSPPFKELAADYMFYHVLTKPNGSSFTSWEGPIVDPFFKMQAGRGYFITMELSHADHMSSIDKRWNFEGDNSGIYHERRARGGYVFNRMSFEDYSSKVGGPQANFRRFTYDDANVEAGTDAWGKRDRVEALKTEKFNVEPVKVELIKGLNFVGNPFMSPISLNCLLGVGYDGYGGDVADSYPDVPDAEADVKFEVKLLGDGVYASTMDPVGAQLRTKYWLINQAQAKYDPTKNIFEYRASYDFISRDGASGGDIDQSSSIIDPAKYLIAPMQMFCLQTEQVNGVTITMDPKLRTFGQTRAPKSTKSAAAESAIMRDWFVVEAQDNVNNVADRTTVIFRDGAIPTSKDNYDSRKGLNDEYENDNVTYTDANGYASEIKRAEARAIVYTKSSDNMSMLGNAIPKKTKELPLFFNAPQETQEVTLKFYGLDNVEAVQGVWLIDRLLDNKTMKVSQGDEYSFVSNTTDSQNLVGGNRFILRFYPDDSDVIGDGTSEISCYYNSSTLYIKGLNEDDMNSDVTIYDMQGRLMARTKVNETPSMRYLKPLSLGTYILKITGNRNYTTKFVNLQAN